MTKKERLLAHYMDPAKDEELAIQRLDGDTIHRLKEYANTEHTAIIYTMKPFRVEHPHCAIYKKPVEIGQGSAERITLYTPDGRLYSDYLLDGISKGQVVKPYIKKQKNLETLLFYLKDIQVYWDQGAYDMALDQVDNQGLVEIALSKTPWQNLLQYIDEALLIDLYKKQDKLLLRCLKELGRIAKDEIVCLAKSSVCPDIYLAYIDDQIDPDIDQALYTDYYLKYYDKVKKALPRITLTVSSKEGRGSLPEDMVAHIHIDPMESEDKRMQPTG